MATTFSSLMVRIGADLAGLKSGMAQANTVVSQGARAMEGAFSRLKLAVGGALAGFGAQRLGSEFLQANKAVDTFRRGMATVKGSAAGAADELDYIRRVSDRLGLSVTDAGDAYLQLQAAAKGTRLEGAPSRRIFEAVASAMSKLGRSSADTGGALLAIQQIISKGKVSAEELRGQLGERLPGAFQVAAKAIGVTTGELDKLLQEGKVVAEDFLPKFAAALTNAYGGSTDKVSGFTAEVNRLKNAWQELLVALGDTGVFSALADSIKGVVTAFREWQAQGIDKGTGRDDIEQLNKRIEQLTAERKRVAEALVFLGRDKALADIDRQLGVVTARRDAAVQDRQQVERRAKVGAGAPERPAKIASPFESWRADLEASDKAVADFDRQLDELNAKYEQAAAERQKIASAEPRPPQGTRKKPAAPEEQAAYQRKRAEWMQELAAADAAIAGIYAQQSELVEPRNEAYRKAEALKRRGPVGPGNALPPELAALVPSRGALTPTPSALPESLAGGVAKGKLPPELAALVLKAGEGQIGGESTTVLTDIREILKNRTFPAYAQ